MKTKILLTIAILSVFAICTNATPVDVNIYSDTTITDGDEYGTVNIYDTPPDQTTVTMTGGDIEYCNIYDTANLNFSGGEILLVTTYNNSKATINSDSGGVFELYDYSQVHLYNGGFSNSVWIYGNAELYVYGYSLTFNGDDWIDGYWSDGQEFRLFLRNSSSYNVEEHVFLHEIPEPVTFILLTFGGFLLRRTRK